MNKHIFGVLPENIASIMLPNYTWIAVIAGTLVIDFTYGSQGTVSFQGIGWEGVMVVPIQNILAVSKSVDE